MIISRAFRRNYATTREEMICAAQDPRYVAPASSRRPRAAFLEGTPSVPGVRQCSRRVPSVAGAITAAVIFKSEVAVAWPFLELRVGIHLGDVIAQEFRGRAIRYCVDAAWRMAWYWRNPLIWRSVGAIGVAAIVAIA